MKGFIINHESNRSFSENHETPDEMVFYGILEDGKPFIWKQRDPYIIAFLTDELPEKYQSQVWKKVENNFTDYRKKKLHGYFFKNQSGLAALRAAHPDLVCYESDIIAEEQFLMSKYILGSVDFLSEPERVEEGTAYYTDPKVKAVKDLHIPRLKVLSLDIETGMTSDEIYAIGVYGDDIKRVLLLNKNTDEGTRQLEWGEVITYPSEKKLLMAFQDLVISYNPQIFIGWNVMGFDFSFILRKFKEHEIKPNWGIGETPVISFKGEKGRSSLIIKIPGRAIIEGMDLVKGVYNPLPNYRLNTAAFYILDQTKTIEKTGKEKVDEIERLYREDQDELARYNLYDAELVYRIFQKLDGINFISNASALSGVVPEKIFNPHEVLDRLYLPQLHRNKVAAYNRSDKENQINLPPSTKSFPGGFHSNVAVIDIRNLALTVIMAYRIDPLGMVRAQDDREGASMIPSGVFFHNQDHILPGLIKNFLDLQHQAQESSRTAMVSAIDNILEQISAAFTSNYSRYFLPGLSEVLETNIRLVMESIINKIGDQINRVIFYDNTSFAVSLNQPFDDFIKKLSETMSPASLFGIFSGLEKKENYLCRINNCLFFKEFFITDQESGNTKNHFEYWALDSEGEFINKSGKKLPLELVSKVCDQVVYRLLKKMDIEEYLKTFKKALLAGEMDKELVYEKRLSKKLSEYSKSGSLPPQVTAALKVPQEYPDDDVFNRKVTYCQTVKGPEPTQALSSPLDYDHYLKKEFSPALEVILKHSEHKELLYFMQNQDYQLSLF